MSQRGANIGRILLIVSALLFTAPGVWAQLEVYEGTLSPGDAKLGRYFDTYSLFLEEGDRAVIELSSADFDALLLLEAPDGAERENDDYGEGSDSRLDFIASIPGEWLVKATSYDDDEEGAYTLTILRERIGPVQRHTGFLDEGDAVALKGEYFDTYTVRIQENQRIVLDLESEGFDSYLILEPPVGLRLSNDDYLSDSSSRLEYIGEASGTCRIHVTSFEAAETGSYVLTVVFGSQVDIQVAEGVIDQEDEILPDYGYSDEYLLTLRAGQHIAIEMTSEEVDTVLFLEMPDGSFETNDDYDDTVTDSRLEIYAPEDGEYRIKAAAFSEEESGAYTLKLYNYSGSQNPVYWSTR